MPKIDKLKRRARAKQIVRRFRTVTSETRPMPEQTVGTTATTVNLTTFNTTPPLLRKEAAAAYLGFKTLDTFDLVVTRGDIERPIRADGAYLTRDLDDYVQRLKAERDQRRTAEQAAALKAEEAATKAASPVAPPVGVERSLFAEAAK